MFTIPQLSFFFFLLLCNLPAFAADDIVATRIWPSPEYTRITVESATLLQYEQMILQNPERIVVDLKNIYLGKALEDLTSQVKEEDPSIQSIRVGQFNPKVSRIVIDLKGTAKVKVFSLDPIEPYKHRLVIDVYPENYDALASLLKQLEDETYQASDEVITKDEVKPEPGINKQPKPEPIIVAIDAGHGGEDPGARGKRGTKEKVVVLKIAKKLKALIDAEKNMKAVLIRDGDYFVPLATRVKKARAAKADIFVSIHADAFKKRSVSGSGVYALSDRGASSAFAKFLANQENEADLIGGVSIDDKDPILAKTLLDLSQSATINDSLRLGKQVLLEIKKVNNLHKKYVEQAGFAVLKAPDIPSILVETAFISNPEEEKNLRSTAFQNKLAKSILLGIKNYIHTQPSIAFYLEKH
ncbi:MAG: N-acetylmuramoyl-L-alanine amidase [Proteobacteria bacterium]|jgi:N-acetylmuramoyl-L-alanine amidase|nr:N-acetylmuramoyl-L-alanine amidase [Pseudomonadota bacterium]